MFAHRWRGRRWSAGDEGEEGYRGWGRHGGRHGRGGHSGKGWGRRYFEHGALRIIALALIAEKPRNGYEIIKAVEERTGGAYAPSPGVIYPTLTLLEEQGHIVQSAEDGKKVWAITPEGQAALDANKKILDAFEARFTGEGPTVADRGELRRAVRRLIMAVRAKMASGELNETSVGTLVAAIDAAAEAVEGVEPEVPLHDASALADRICAAVLARDLPANFQVRDVRGLNLCKEDRTPYSDTYLRVVLANYAAPDGDYVKKGQTPRFERVERGVYRVYGTT